MKYRLKVEQVRQDVPRIGNTDVRHLCSLVLDSNKMLQCIGIASDTPRQIWRGVSNPSMNLYKNIS